jgi:hypothetical protein
LRDMAQLGGARETQRLRHGKEIPYLVHFHHDTVGVEFAVNMMSSLYLTDSYGSMTKRLSFAKSTKQGGRATVL